MFTSVRHSVGHNRIMPDRKTFLEQERPAEFFSRWTSADSIASERAAVSRLRSVLWARPLLNTWNTPRDPGIVTSDQRFSGRRADIAVGMLTSTTVAG